MIFHKIKNKLIRHFGLTNFVWKNKANGIYCFNFHRIGDATTCLFDPCVFSCTEKDFKRYIRFIKHNFEVLSQEQLISLVASKSKLDKSYAYITFDDGYKDNYEVAFPALQSESLPATFFVATGLIESNVVAWWDEIAWHVKQCANKTIQLSTWSTKLTIGQSVSSKDIREVLSQFKKSPKSIDSQLVELREVSGKRLSYNESEFMSWEQLGIMEQNGMTIGAHSHSHRILSSLNKEELAHELSYSKELLEGTLKNGITTISYPVGNSTTYNSEMFEEIEKQGYKLAFTFRYFVNQNINSNRYQLARLSISAPFNEKEFKSLCIDAPKL
jgi:peptidoglycan/xylan/chitin deacetylase (PgdA/CDA1 family)